MIRLRLLPEADPNQVLRIKRFLMAGAVYLLTLGLMALYVAEDLMPAGHWLLIAGLVLSLNVIIYGYLRSGRNERLRDPSLTGLQMVAACLLLGLTAYLVDDARGALLLPFLVLLMFGVLRLRGRDYALMGVLAVLCYGAAIAAVMHFRPVAVDLREEVLQLLALAVMVPAGGFLAGYVWRLRRALRAHKLELQRARKTVHELRLQDQLTGVLNRHSVVELLREEVQRAAHLDLPLATLIVDLDHFKRVNLDYGHDRGDELLGCVAERLRRALRSIDGVGRYGGEEFLVILPDTDAADAARTAGRLLELVRRCRLEAAPAAPPLNASVGVAERGPDDTPWSLIERARRRAEEALEQGGNRVTVEQPSRVP